MHVQLRVIFHAVAVVLLPCPQERWLGVAGRQTTLCGKPIKTRECADVMHAYLYATTPHMFEGERFGPVYVV